MKLQLLAGGALVALLAGCGSDPVYYTEPAYVSSPGAYSLRGALDIPVSCVMAGARKSTAA